MSNILLGVSGGIAVYKVVHLARLLKKSGHTVRVILTENASKFVTPLTFEYISGNPVSIDEFAEVRPDSIEHIGMGDWADAFLIAPATANTVAKMAHGIADNLLTSTIMAYPGTILVSPAMNTNMYLNPVTQENLALLKKRGHIVIDPDSGELACGITGAGRMPEPEVLVQHIEAFLARKTGELSGKKVVVTAGPTVEDIDPVRYISNRSSGKMGYAIAAEARSMGADVTLISGPVNLEAPDGVTVVPVRSAVDMLEALQKSVPEADMLVMAAAVADYAVEQVAEKKLKKEDGEDTFTLKLKKNPDILKTLAPHKKPSQVFVGFAAETHELAENAQKKLVAKNLDMIVANDVSRKDIGFDTDENETTLFFANEAPIQCEKAKKSSIARDVLAHALRITRVKQS